MNFLFSVALILMASACVFATDENEVKKENFQVGSPQPSYDIKSNIEVRFLFNTVTLSLQTVTITSVITSLTTCTTSTAALSVCTGSGRRRRGLHVSGNKEGRGLFYNENEEQSEEGSIYLPHPNTREEIKTVESEVESNREDRSSAKLIPYVVQSGFDVPDGQGRFFVSFGTSTITTTSTTTSISSLTAICKSTTGYQLCGSSGK